MVERFAGVQVGKRPLNGSLKYDQVNIRPDANAQSIPAIIYGTRFVFFKSIPPLESK